MRAIVSDQVTHFLFKGRKYLPGEVVVLPDTFPVRLYSFLKVHADKPVAAPRGSRTVPSPIPPPAAKTPPPAPTGRLHQLTRRR